VCLVGSAPSQSNHGHKPLAAGAPDTSLAKLCPQARSQIDAAPAAAANRAKVVEAVENADLRKRQANAAYVAA
jgi:hypothetical protein